MALVVLNNTSKKLQVLLGGAVSTNELPIVVSYRDIGAVGVSYQSADAISTGGTAVDVLAAPPAGKRYEVEGMSIYNADTATATVTVRQYVNASTTRIIIKAAILTAETLLYSEAQGWHVVDANGNRKENSNTADSVNISTADSKADSASTRASTASSQAASAGTAASTASSQALSAGTAASTASSQALSAGTAASTASSAASLAQANSSAESSVVSRVKSSFSW